MFVIASKNRREEISEVEQQAVAEFIRCTWSGYCTTQPFGIMSKLDKQEGHHFAQESDPDELRYYIRFLGNAVAFSVKYFVDEGRRLDLLTACCLMLPVLADALDSNTPVNFEFA